LRDGRRRMRSEREVGESGQDMMNLDLDTG
jgi:hypothetical protein